MAQQPFLATIVGIPHIPAVTEVNVRSGPGTNYDMMFKSPVGTANLQVIEVQPDAENKALSGKVYQWFRLAFPDSQVGWVRDDLIEVTGDGTASGYTMVAQPTLAFNLTRREELRPGQEVVTTDQMGTSTTTTETPTETSTPAAETTATTTETRISASEPAMIICMGKSGANVRTGPALTYRPIGRLNYLQEAPILGAQQGDQPGDPFKWIKISFQGSEGWVREDFMRLKGGFGQFGIGAEDLYPSSIPDSWWVRDFNLDENKAQFTSVHWGWDHGANTGSRILAGPKGGTVHSAVFCQKCGAEGASTLNRGFSLSDSRVLNDQGWNFGYGHYIIVRYLNEQLPASTQQQLASQGFSGAHIFVMYAHLSQMRVQAGQTLQPNQHIADCGNSGNSQAAHLHLEIRAHANANERNWARMRSGLMTPAVLYRR